MSRVKLYLNEDVHTAVARGLRNRAFDVVTTDELGKKGQSDLGQLKLAIKEERTIVSFNVKDFVSLHQEYAEAEKEHYGIIVSSQLPIGELLKRLLNVCSLLSAEDMRNRLEYLSQWK